MKIYTLRRICVICPKCEVVFATTQVARKPNVSIESKVEADLHRVLPDGVIRASNLATCPECIYTWWLSSFAQSFVLPQMAPDAPPVENSKKFGHAVLTGRKENAHALDTAMVALNGYWCAREDHQNADKWLELVVKELEKALADESWFGNRSRYNYIMGEMYRLKGDFHSAVRLFNQVDRRSVLPKELVDHQIHQAKIGNSKPVLLPPHIIRAVFKIKEPAPAAAQASGSNMNQAFEQVSNNTVVNFETPTVIA